MIESVEFQITILEAQRNMHKILTKLPLLEESNRASLLVEENRGQMLTWNELERGDSGIFDRCKNALHQSLDELDNLLFELYGLQKE